MRRFVAFLLLPLAVPVASQQSHHELTNQVLAPGYATLQFPAPLAGTYSLPSLGMAADGKLLDSTGTPVTLYTLFDGKTIVLSFIYTTCSDVNGCPLATFVLSRIQERLSADDRLKNNVRLISVSFDVTNDSPEVMANYARSFQRSNVDWSFLTAASQATLEPILNDYGQSVIRSRDPDGRELGAISHILRVFLIDPQKNIRNIYSPSFLHPDLLLADIGTVAER